MKFTCASNHAALKPTNSFQEEVVQASVALNDSEQEISFPWTEKRACALLIRAS